MGDKRWQSYDMTINGLTQRVRYNAATVEGLFLPLLQRLSQLQKKAQRRILVFLAAPPATGKSTLLAFLAQYAHAHAALARVQALGMDGFHHPNRYLAAHTITRDGQEVALAAIKGAPETFDVAHLAAKLRAAKEGAVLFRV